MAFHAIHDVDHDGRLYAPREPIEFGAGELARYAADKGGPIGRLLAAGAIAAGDPKPVPPLHPARPGLTIIEYDRNGLGPLSGPTRASNTGVDGFWR